MPPAILFVHVLKLTPVVVKAALPKPDSKNNN